MPSEPVIPPKQPWMSLEGGIWEVNDPGNEIIRVNIGMAQVEIDKLYGPLWTEAVRVRLDAEHAEWVVERQHYVTHQWEEKARWDCQETREEEKQEES